MSADREPLPWGDPNHDVAADLRRIWDDWSNADPSPPPRCTYCGAYMHVRAHVGLCPLAGEDPVRPTLVSP